jgi:hypothetical protein
MTDPPENRHRRRFASPRVTALLAAAMLAVGVAVGAAIGPAPNASFAGSPALPVLLRALSALEASRTSSPASTAATQPPPSVHARRRQRRARAAAPTPSAATAPRAPASPSSEASTPAPSTPTSRTTPLAPVTHVWLVELAGSTFAEALAAPTTAPYIDTQAIPAGELLSGSSALAGSALASEAALLAGTPPQLVQTIVQPPCPEGAAAAQCAPGTPGGLSAADAFLAQTIPVITANASYKSQGLIVVTFASVASAAATGLPGGGSVATVTAEPPAGVLLISPFAPAGKRSSAAFTPAAPRQSLEKLLHR